MTVLVDSTGEVVVGGKEISHVLCEAAKFSGESVELVGVGCNGGVEVEACVGACLSAALKGYARVR